jgi:tellurite resistance protein
MHPPTPSSPPRSVASGLLEKIIGKLREPASFSSGTKGSLLTVAGAQYGDPADPPALEEGEPAGFDPEAAALFEAVIESAYLVAVADGHFDDTERGVFEHVVLAACGGRISRAQLQSLLADLGDLHEEDGIDKRVRMVARTISRPDHAREVLRIASLIAQASEGVSAVERGVLEKLAHEFKLDGAAVDRAVAEATRALAE